jgi:fructan beta-fructosidase
MASPESAPRPERIRAWLLFTFAGWLSATFWPPCSTFAQDAYNEPWRPQFHFTPPKNFMNDPNGLVFYEGEYHLFYQYNPQGTQWGHMSWGHAVSADMLHWKNLPVAIPEQPAYMIYSGSAVVDWHNSSGLCRGAKQQMPSCLIAIYTAAGKDWQRQNLAFSNDRGRTWTNFPGNPVADLKLPDFRDPKVFWYEPQKKWVMVAVTADEKKVVLFDSHDLKSWTLQSSFQDSNQEKGQWECPDLFQLAVDGDANDKRWVLIVNRNPGAPAGGTGTEYFVGQFDGSKFVNGGEPGQELWADFGKDFYATNSFSDIPSSDGRRIWIGWIGNWQYANREPTEVWRGAQSLPRELKLARYSEGIRLVQRPVTEITKLRQRELCRLSNLPVPAAQRSLQQAEVRGSTVEIEAELAPENSSEIGFRLRKGADEETLVAFSPRGSEVFIDRTKSGVISFSPDFPGCHKVKVRGDAKVRLRIFVDRSSLEVFVNDGETVLTDRIYARLSSDGIELYSDGDKGRVISLSIWKFASIWQ